MKKIIFISFAACTLAACSNDGTKSSTETDTSTTSTANSEGTADNTTPNANVNTDTSMSTGTVVKADAATEKFLKKAADGGMAEVEVGNIARETATDPSVKNFAAMMVNDHTAANSEVKALATRGDVALPAAPSDYKKQHASRLAQKKGKEFDKAYMDMMVKDHKQTIDIFEDAQRNSKDEQVKAFVSKTLPTLKIHLDSAQAISKRIK